MKLAAVALVAGLIAGASSGLVTYRLQEQRLEDLRGELEAQSDALDAETSILEKASNDLLKRLRTINKRLGRALERNRRADELLEARVGGFPPVTSLPDGRYFAFIRSLQQRAAGVYVVIDQAEFLSGEEANEAAEAEGEIEEGEGVPNDYWIRNFDPELRTLRVNPSSRVVVSFLFPGADVSHGSGRISLDRLICVFRRPYRPYVLYNKFWVTVGGGDVVKFEEQYVP